MSSEGRTEDRTREATHLLQARREQRQEPPHLRAFQGPVRGALAPPQPAALRTALPLATRAPSSEEDSRLGPTCQTFSNCLIWRSRLSRHGSATPHREATQALWEEGALVVWGWDHKGC